MVPGNPGEYSLFPEIERPPFGVRAEWYVCTPLGGLVALIPEVHRCRVHENGTLSASPSVVAPDGWHGFIREGVFS